MDGTGRRRTARRLTATRRHRWPSGRNDDLYPVGKRRREVDEREIGLARRAACLRDRVGDPRARGKSVEAGSANSSDDVDNELRPGVGPHRRGGHRRSSLLRRARGNEMPGTQEEHHREEERAGSKPPARGGKGVQHVVKIDNKPVTRG